MYILFHREDGTLTSVGEFSAPEVVGAMVLTKEQHDEFIADMDAFIMAGGNPRRRTKKERKARFLEVSLGVLSGELSHNPRDSHSILNAWAEEFKDEAW